MTRGRRTLRLALCALLALPASCARCSSSSSTETVTSAPESKKKEKPRSTGVSPYLADLPEGAALYGTLRLDAVELVTAVLPEKEVADLERLAKEQCGAPLTKDGLADALGLDASRPLAFAVVPGASSEIVALVHQAVVDGGTSAAIDAALDAANAGARPAQGAVRIIVPLAKGKSTDKLLDLLKRASKGALTSCDGTGAGKGDCPKVGARTPSLASADTAIYLTDQTMQIDHVLQRDPTPEQSARWLGWLGASTGGPKTRCLALDDDAAASICLSAPELAALGQGSGSYKVLGALASPGIDPAQLLRILAEGEKEVGRAATLAAAPAGDLSDGTFTVQLRNDRVQLVESFRLGARTPKGLDPAVCRKRLDELATEVVPLLRDGLLPGKPAYSTADLPRDLAEAGWAGPAILAAGQWPLALPLVDPTNLKVPFIDAPCLSVENGRLQLRASASPKELGQALKEMRF